MSTASITFISPFASASSPNPIAVSVDIPATDRLPLTPMSGYDLTKDINRRGSCMPPLLGHLQVEEAKDRRRASVDLASLYKQKENNKRSRCDAADEEGDKSETPTLPAIGRESMFADHLSAILAHSLSLCSGNGETSLDLYARGEVSPISTPGSETDDALSGPQTHAYGTSPRDSYFQQYRVKRQPSTPTLNPFQRRRLIDLLQSWSFNALELDQDELWEAACIMFEGCLRMQGVNENITMQQIRDLIYSLRSAYHARNGYHNFAHATDVLQAIYSFLVTLQVLTPLHVLLDEPCSSKWSRPVASSGTGLGEIIRPMDVFCLMVAAIGHDVGHPGLSNAYMVNAKTPVAQVYGDQSVLENFHTVTLMQMLRKHGLSHVFGNVDSKPAVQHNECRKVLYASVLATDMSRHFHVVAKLQEMARFKASKNWYESREEECLLICSALMKCADISNPTRPHAIAKAWSTALLEEWSVQAKIEEEFQLPISVVTLNPAEAQAQAKSQVGFINLFTQPLFDATAANLSGFDLYANFCRTGRIHWEAVVLSNALSVPIPMPSAAVDDVDSTPKLGSDSRLESVDGLRSKRKHPPRPLNLSSFRDNRTSSFDSAISTSPQSPYSPIFLSNQRTLSSFSSISTYSSASSAPSPTRTTGLVSCIGACSAVTAKCAACAAKEAETTGKRRVSKRSSTSAPLSSRPLCEDWPPAIFHPL